MVTGTEAQQCSATIDGPKVGYRVVAWRKRCRNKTRHNSGLCHVHRDPTWWVGKRVEDRDERFEA